MRSPSGLIAGFAFAAAALSACAPAVGSKEWCDKVIKEGLAKVAEMPKDQQEAAAKCAADELNKGLSGQ